MPDRRSAAKGASQHEATAGYFGPLRSARYMLLTTFKQDGIPVSSHVHGVVDGDRAYFISPLTTWPRGTHAEPPICGAGA